MSYKIHLHGCDPEDNCYCAVVLARNVIHRDGGSWYNAGIVMRDVDPINAVARALTEARNRFGREFFEEFDNVH